MTDNDDKLELDEISSIIAGFMKNPAAAAQEVKAAKIPTVFEPSRRKSAENVEPHIRNNSVRDVARFEIPVDVEETAEIDISETVKLIMQKRYEYVNLRQTSVPSKRSVKHACSTRKMLPADRVFKGLPGSSRNRTLDAIRAIAAEDTGCIVDNNMRSRPEHMVPTTTRGDGNVLAGYQVVRHKEHGKTEFSK
jgi:hypothetical protein